MAAEDTKSFPMMPIKSWWALRRKFRSSIPATVTPDYIASVLSITTLAARNNILPTLRRIGLIDSTGKPESLATSWRDDAKYPEVCAQIVKRVYPQEIRDITADKTADRDQIQSWFANHTSSGVSAARKMSLFYSMLLEANPNVETRAAAPSASRREVAPKPKSELKRPARAHVPMNPVVREEREERSSYVGAPAFHINLQIHISSDATGEQIDKIFSSMARHLKDMKS